jgi:hypothetical protein
LQALRELVDQAYNEFGILRPYGAERRSSGQGACKFCSFHNSSDKTKTAILLNWPLRLNTTAAGQSTCGRFFVKEKYYKLAEGAIRQGMAKPLAGTTRACKGLVLMQMLYTAIAPPSR